MQKLLDYIFYRIWDYYTKKKDDVPIITAILFVWVIQYSALLFIGISFNFATGDLFSGEVLGHWLYWSIYLSVGFTLLIHNLLRYIKEKKRLKIKARFSSMKINKTIKTWQIFCIPIYFVALALFVIYVFGENN